MGSVGTCLVLLIVVGMIIRSNCVIIRDEDSGELDCAEEEALIAAKKGLPVSPPTGYNLSSNNVPNNKLKNHFINSNNDRRQNQVLLQNQISNSYKPKIPQNPHITIHNDLKNSGTEI